ncbi:AraC family transcriptional regulator [Bacillus solitudinis]|uniref:AraC family transcriptional regulator n=1 Tax=Bacillus solitudinis TaxID=2014074 RepID=UPI000C23B1FC|nr:AraC family transcriptional regulator [Bacillus solitudinis]
MQHRREFITPLNEHKLPLYAETIGFNPNQDKMIRPNGYPFYHWIQTVRGKGILDYQNQIILLPPNSGTLLLPSIPHSYRKDSQENWETFYLTFDGEMVKEILMNLDLLTTPLYSWEADTPLTNVFEIIDQQKEDVADIFNIKASTIVYQFLLLLKKYGKLQENTAISSNLSKLRPLIDWMKINLSNPDFGLNDMAEYLGFSKRYLNSLFRMTFNVTPYIYFLNLRIQKSKQLLLQNKTVTVKNISFQVGFRSPSHFVATFHRMVGTSPDQYRNIN